MSQCCDCDDLHRYQCDYKMEAMRGMGVDRHLFGLYVMAKGLKMDPMPKMFTDKVLHREGWSHFRSLLIKEVFPLKSLV